MKAASKKAERTALVDLLCVEDAKILEAVTAPAMIATLAVPETASIALLIEKHSTRS